MHPWHRRIVLTYMQCQQATQNVWTRVLCSLLWSRQCSLPFCQVLAWQMVPGHRLTCRICCWSACSIACSCRPGSMWYVLLRVLRSFLLDTTGLPTGESLAISATSNTTFSGQTGRHTRRQVRGKVSAPYWLKG